MFLKNEVVFHGNAIEDTFLSVKNLLRIFFAMERFLKVLHGTVDANKEALFLRVGWL